MAHMEQQTKQPFVFETYLHDAGLAPLRKSEITTLQVNLGKLCNQSCSHCHVGAGPNRTESMSDATADRILGLMETSPALNVLDLTGGAPELNPSFTRLVEGATNLGKRVIDRCNLTVLTEPGMEAVAEFLARHGVEVVASLPCYTRENVEAQRGPETFDRSVRALKQLNELGYGADGSALTLNLVYNPGNAFLPAPQATLEQDYKSELNRGHGISFNNLFTITNMPINRFGAHLDRTDQRETYMRLLVDAFNPNTVSGLMCQTTVSVGWDGRIYDCDFNQMLDLQIRNDASSAPTVFDMESLSSLSDCQIATGPHCFGCTAGTGSSCTGALQ